jgi:3D (Asp-Asp-Asp) domain-containing protein
VIVTVTAYCLAGITALGTHTHPGTLAVDPRVIPLGSRVVIHGANYRAEDTGAYIHGHHVDAYFTSCDEAKTYGARRVKIEVKQ